ncbi:MAG: exodeoxyribonuclease VII small subunit [Desulfobacterales bacterium]|nr:exodeoxyribonuclease VII small subunit [Desulfobacterales bacterium]
MAKKKTFENAMQQLEQIVADLEAGDIPLDKALQKFEEGMSLSKYCTDRLDETEKKVSLLLADSRGELQEHDFSEEV